MLADPAQATYHPFDVEEAAAYAATCPPLRASVAADAALWAREVGDGNLNLVFIVSGDDGSSAAIKQALPYVRLVGESWPITTQHDWLCQALALAQGVCAEQLA
jgi:5-methylthioribose kinase